MYMVVSPPALLFFLALLFGAGLGVVWDCLRLLRLSLPTGRVIAFLQDLLFGLVWAAATLLFFALYTDGGFRWFVPAGELLGFSVYYFTVGRVVYAVLKVVVRWIKKLVWVISWPLRKIFGLAARIGRRVFGKLSASGKKVWKTRKNRLPFVGRLLYNKSTYQSDPARRGRKQRTRRCRQRRNAEKENH